MTEIFKYFFGIIGVLILVYVLIVVLRMVLVNGASTGMNILGDKETQEKVASNTKDVVQAVGQFSLAEWLRSFRPFAYAPIEVTTDVTDRVVNNPRFYNDDLTKYEGYYASGGGSWRENLNWQNLNEQPNNHPTGVQPVDSSYYSQFFNPENSENGGGIESDAEGKKLQASAEYIRPFTRPGEILYDNGVLNGTAYFKVFTTGRFMIYVLDEYGNTVHSIVAYTNGDLGHTGWVPFRAVLDTDKVPIRRGFLMYKNENVEVSAIKAVNIVPVVFAK